MKADVSLRGLTRTLAGPPADTGKPRHKGVLTLRFRRAFVLSFVAWGQRISPASARSIS